MDNKEWILITGASSGMGREMAIQFSSVFRVILNGRDFERFGRDPTIVRGFDKQLIWQYDLGNVEELETAFIGFLSGKQRASKLFRALCRFHESLPVEDGFRDPFPKHV